MAHRTEFYLYKRKKQKASYWYVCYLDRESGKQMTAKSIDVLKERLGFLDFRSVTRRDEAVIIAKKALDSGIIFSNEANLPFIDYCLNFWDWDTSEYIKLRNASKEGSIGREYANNMKFFLRKHVEKYIPSQLKLHSVQTRHLDKVIISLKEDAELASGTIQLIALSFSIPLKEAYRKSIIASNPALKMMRIVRMEKERGCFSYDECLRILSYLKEHKKDMYPSYYLAITLAMVTGMRSGEVRALNIRDIEQSRYDGLWKIRIAHSLSPYSGLKGTKGNYERSALIPEALKDELFNNADRKGILLPSRWGGYISSPTLRNTFYQVLDEVGIDEKIRKERNLTFHSLRHSFSTLGRDRDIPQEDRMVVLGHKSREVNDRYTHASDEALCKVFTLTSELFSKL